MYDEKFETQQKNHRTNGVVDPRDLIFNVAGVEDIIEYTLNDEKNSLTAEADEFFQLKEVLLNEN